MASTPTYPPSTSSSPAQLTCLVSLSTPTTTRAWQSTPHPHNPLLATATADKAVTVWSLRDFRLLSTIAGGHKRSVRSVAWKDTGPIKEGQIPGATVLATGSFDSNTGIWTRNEGRTRVGGRVHGGYLDSEDGGFGDGEEVDGEMEGPADDEEEEWAFSSLLTGPDSEIKSVAFSPTNSALLATSSRDKSVWVWEDVAEAGGGGMVGGDESEYETVAVLAEHTGDVKCLAWHPEREVLASGSYDDTIRMWREVEEEGDWCCVGVLEGHEGTVWGVAWEGYFPQPETDAAEAPMRQSRLASCSDDLSVKIWRKLSRDSALQSNGPRMPSIIRPASSMEDWTTEATLPQAHVRSVYAIAWSNVTGLLVTCGGDGSIYVYKEVSAGTSNEAQTNGATEDVVMNGTDNSEEGTTHHAMSRWVVIASIEAAHAEYEVNHVCWARRQDKGRRDETEEVIVSSGDDGIVRVWALPET